MNKQISRPGKRILDWLGTIIIAGIVLSVLGYVVKQRVIPEVTKAPLSSDQRVEMFRKIPELGALKGGEILKFPDGTLELVSARCFGRDICIAASTSWFVDSYYDIDRSLEKLAAARIIRPDDPDYPAEVAKFKCIPRC